MNVASGMRLVGSVAMEGLRTRDAAGHKRIMDSISLANALGGYIPVRYYMHESQEGYGRMKCQVLADGLHAVPFVHMKREVRAHLAEAYYWDVDMANCQPRLFKQKLDQLGVACPLLETYVAQRESCLREVMQACNVERDAAKNLFIRLLYLGSIAAWREDFKCAEPPPWIHDLADEMRKNAETMYSLPEFQDLKRYSARRQLTISESLEPANGSHREFSPGPVSAIGSLLALYLQTLECKCVRALVEAMQSDGRKVGGIIYDGAHVEKLSGEQTIPHSDLSQWRGAVLHKTGYDVELTVKPFALEADWLCAQSSTSSEAEQRDNDIWDERWMQGHILFAYDEMKARWEQRSFKIVKGGNYVREEKDNRVPMSDRVLLESYKHLHYAQFRTDDNGRVTVQLKPFIAHWVKDPLIRRYKSMVFRPPPLETPPEMYSIWNGFAVDRYKPAADRGVDVDSAAVKMFLEFISILCNRNDAVTGYLLDWMAQLFQQPSRKTGVALLLKGEEGVGKNRFTDLIGAMLGADKSLNTSSPKNTLYGEFTQLREGKFLIVINEANGGDNFAANDIIKDMITSDTFVCNAKSQNSYSIECFARFVFTTNNDNCLKVDSGSRRYQVIQVSSELKGNTEYFKALSAAMEDMHNRYELYRYLLARDISGRDWVNDRLLTESFAEMVSLNLPYEFHFVKDLIMAHDDPENPTLTLTSEELFNRFNEWLQAAVTSEQARARHNTSSIKFGVTLTKLVASDTNRAGFRSVSKTRKRVGIVYTFDVAGMRQELLDKHWVLPEDEDVSVAGDDAGGLDGEL